MVTEPQVGCVITGGVLRQTRLPAAADSKSKADSSSDKKDKGSSKKTESKGSQAKKKSGDK